MGKVVLLIFIFSCSAYAQRVKENIKQQNGVSTEKPGKPVKPIKPIKSIRR